MIGLSALCGQRIVAGSGGVFEGPAGGVLIPVTGVLHELLLGDLESLGLALPGLDQRLPCFVRAIVAQGAL